MTQSRRTLDTLLKQGQLPLTKAQTAARALEIYPHPRTWLAFFDKVALIIGSVALVLSLVFFVAYNWLYLGKLGKFALVEGALVVSIAAYVYLVWQRRLLLVQQLLLLIASVITGSLLALLGQVYQTGADTWQLFAVWALLMTPWVLIGRFPALWLLWLGLIHAAIALYIDVAAFAILDYEYTFILRVAIFAVVYFIAFTLWLFFLEPRSIFSPNLSSKFSLSSSLTLHWSSYLLGLLSAYFACRLAVIHVMHDADIALSMLGILAWVGWCGVMWWLFYRRRIDVFMLTVLCGALIGVVIVWVAYFLLESWGAFGFLVLGLLLIGSSSMAVTWLRGVARADNTSSNTAGAATARGVLTEQGDSDE